MKTWVLILALTNGEVAEHPDAFTRAECLEWAFNITTAQGMGYVPTFPLIDADGALQNVEVAFAFCRNTGGAAHSTGA